MMYSGLLDTLMLLVSTNEIIINSSISSKKFRQKLIQDNKLYDDALRGLLNIK